MKDKKYLLFDLDGTLTDPFTGITRSVQHALKHYGIIENDLNLLTPFIGPPLIDSFRERYHSPKSRRKKPSAITVNISWKKVGVKTRFIRAFQNF